MRDLKGRAGGLAPIRPPGGLAGALGVPPRAHGAARARGQPGDVAPAGQQPGFAAHG